MSRLIGIRDGQFLFEMGETVKCPEGVEVRVDPEARKLFVQFPGSPATLQLTEHDRAGRVYCVLVAFLIHHGIKVGQRVGGQGMTVNRAAT